MARLITIGEYLSRVIPIIFRKKRKAGTRTVDIFFDLMGQGMDALREQIVTASEMMHPATAGGTWADRWGKILGGLYRIPAESDAAYQHRLGQAAAFWKTAGATGFFEAWLAQIGWTVSVAPHPTRWMRRVMTISTGGEETDCLQLVHDLDKFGAAHLVYVLELAGEVAYAGADYYETGGGEPPTHWTGWDDRQARPAVDYFKEF